MKLTIAIPSYDRNALLHESLRWLLPQLTPDCELLIIDNASPSPVEESIAALLLEHSLVRTRVVRNRANIGGGANILRCFELCETEWIWLLGDDDRVSLGAISGILRDLKKHTDALFLNYSSPCFRRTSGFTTTGTREFAEKLDSFSNALFMSAGVFNVPRLVPHLRFGFMYSYSWAPQLALLLAAIGKNGQCVFSADSIIEEYCRAGVENMWSPIGPLLGKMSLLELPLEDAARRALAKKINAAPSLEYIVTLLIHQQKTRNVNFDAVYAFDQMTYRLFYFQRSPIHRIRIPLYRILVKYPTFGLGVIKLIYKLFGWIPIVRRNPLPSFVVVDPAGNRW